VARRGVLEADRLGLSFDHLERDMGSPWDGRERCRGHSREALREHLRQLREAWEAVQRDTQLELENENDKTTLAVHGDNDEERCARVDAMLETLRPAENPTRKVVVRSERTVVAASAKSRCRTNKPITKSDTRMAVGPCSPKYRRRAIIDQRGSR